MSNEIDQAIAPDVLNCAAEWLARLQDGDLDEKAYAAWQSWLARDPDHQRAYRDMERIWQLIGETGASVDLPKGKTSAERQPVRRLSKPPRIGLRLAAGFAVAALLGLMGYGLHAWRAAADVLATGTAEQRSLRLADGSRITLGAESKLRSEFSATHRQVTLLRGEAFFDIARDARRPFVVMVGGSRIRVLGTAFNVRANSNGVVVAVAEGRVSFERAAEANPPPNMIHGDRPRQGAAMGSGAHASHHTIVLAAGERAASDSFGLHKLSSIEVQKAAPWREGRLEYIGEELRQVIEDINRYTDRDLVLVQESLGELRYTGTVFPDHLDEWLSGISGTLPIAIKDAGQRREIVAVGAARE